MALRGIRMDTRTRVVAEAIERRLTDVAVTINKYPDIQSPAFHDVNIRSDHGLDLQVRVPSWGTGKPKIRYKRDEDRATAETLAGDLRARGLYLFTPTVEQIRHEA